MELPVSEKYQPCFPNVGENKTVIISDACTKF